ncbi:MAG: hypothetical protein AB7K09_26130 [Planctomycetota bacterium]
MTTTRHDLPATGTSSNFQLAEGAEREARDARLVALLDRWIAVASAEEDDGDYDILRALDENRRTAGDIRMHSPEETGGAGDRAQSE